MMPDNRNVGFVEIAHTADWALKVWAPDFTSLLVEAAHGMTTLLEQTLEPGPRVTRNLSIMADDRESQLVAFLSELLYIAEQEKLGFDLLKLSVDGNRVNASLEGASIRNQRKEIKAVTFHNLKIQQTDHGLLVTIVFDV